MRGCEGHVAYGNWDPPQSGRSEEGATRTTATATTTQRERAHRVRFCNFASMPNPARKGDTVILAYLMASRHHSHGRSA
jgi:hypothetical protein